MPPISPMHMSIDVSQYLRLPLDVRVRFDGWLKAEALIDKKIIRFTLGEGAIEAERICYRDGKPYRDEEGKIATEIVRIPVKSTPPAEAFGGDGRG